MRRRRTFIGAAVISAALVAGAFGALAASGDSTTPPQTYSAYDVSALSADISADASYFEMAAQPGIRDCMAAKGFGFVPGDPTNGFDATGAPIEGWEEAMRGTKRAEFTGFDGLRGSVPAEGCVADARAAIAGSVEACASLVAVRHEIGAVVAAAAAKADEYGVDMATILESVTTQQQLREVVARWHAARSALPPRS